MRFRGVGYAPAPLNNAYELSVSIEPGVSEPSDLSRPSQPRPDDVHHHATALSLSKLFAAPRAQLSEEIKNHLRASVRGAVVARRRGLDDDKVAREHRQ